MKNLRTLEVCLTFFLLLSCSISNSQSHFGFDCGFVDSTGLGSFLSSRVTRTICFSDVTTTCAGTLLNELHQLNSLQACSDERKFRLTFGNEH